MLETSIGAVARVRDFEMSTEEEARPGEDSVPPKEWPASGKVDFKNVTASYG